MKLLEEAIQRKIVPPSFKDSLIRNPNKYSIFYTKYDCNSPSLKKALNNLNL